MGKGFIEPQTCRYTPVMAGTLRGIAHLPDVELIGGDVVECRLLLPLDRTLRWPTVRERRISTGKAFALSRPRIQQLSVGSGPVAWGQ